MPANAKDVLAEPGWLAAHLDDEAVRIVEVDESIATYAEGHIPGAIGLEWERDLQDPLRRDLLSPDDFGELMGSRGIANHHTVVLYGDRDNWFAAYAYWCFVYYGHHKLKLLNGSRRSWVEQGREMNTAVPSYPATSFKVGPPSEQIRAGCDAVRAGLDTGARLVDVRDAREFTGELEAMPGYEREAPQRRGHIPGASSVPWNSALNEDGTFKSADELQDLYGRAGLTEGGEPVIVYCLLGGRSAHTWFVLHELLGRSGVASYDGGWAEWGALVGVPIER